MKNLFIFIIISMLSIQFANSQVRLYSDGNLKFCETSSNNGVKIWRDNPSDYVVRIKGQWNHNLTIGEPANRCDYIYVTNLRYYNMLNLSDKRLKKNIKPINGVLDSILQLEPVKFDYIPFQSEKMTKKENEKSVKNSKNKYGFIAQDVKEIFPHLVSEEEDGMYAINMNGIIALCVEAIKEQQEIIKELEARVETIESDCCSKADGEKLKSGTISSEINADASPQHTELFQNHPNPFSQRTTIEYSIAKNVGNAMICIYDMNGAQLKSIQLHHNGESSIQINGGEYKAGMYLYALIADGQIIDTKRMVLTD